MMSGKTENGKMDHAVARLAAYALETGLIEKSESVWAVNTILPLIVGSLVAYKRK